MFDADFTNTAIYGAIFTDAKVSENTDFGSRCVYDSESSGEIIRMSHPADDPDELTKCIGTYRSLESLFTDNALSTQARQAYINRKKARRKQHFDEGHWFNGIRLAGYQWAMQYGENPVRVILWSAVVIGLSTLLYPIWGLRVTKPSVVDGMITYTSFNGDFLYLIGKSFYFSVITFTTLGYGDIHPVGWAELLATLESIAGALLMALYVFVLGRRATW